MATNPRQRRVRNIHSRAGYHRRRQRHHLVRGADYGHHVLWIFCLFVHAEQARCKSRKVETQ